MTNLAWRPVQPDLTGTGSNILQCSRTEVEQLLRTDNSTLTGHPTFLHLVWGWYNHLWPLTKQPRCLCYTIEYKLSTFNFGIIKNKRKSTPVDVSCFLCYGLLVEPPAEQQDWKKSTAGSLDFTCPTLSAADSTFKYLEYRWFKSKEQQVERLKENQPKPACLSICVTDTAEPSLNLNQISFVCFLGHMFPGQWPITSLL